MINPSFDNLICSRKLLFIVGWLVTYMYIVHQFFFEFGYYPNLQQ